MEPEVLGSNTSWGWFNILFRLHPDIHITFISRHIQIIDMKQEIQKGRRNQQYQEKWMFLTRSCEVKIIIVHYESGFQWKCDIRAGLIIGAFREFMSCAIYAETTGNSVHWGQEIHQIYCRKVLVLFNKVRLISRADLYFPQGVNITGCNMFLKVIFSPV